MIQKTWLRIMSAFSCLFDEQARKVVDYLREENRVLREQLRDKYGCRQVRLTDSQRRRLATKEGLLAGVCLTRSPNCPENAHACPRPACCNKAA
jgi:hypothetical protein